MNTVRYFSVIPLVTALMFVGTPAVTYAQNTPPIDRSLRRPQLNLTSVQRQQMRVIRANTRQRMEAVFTPEQRSRLESARRSGQSWREVMGSLNLTDTQRRQLRDIRKSGREQRLSLLTPEQRAQMEQFRQERRQRANF